MTEVDELRAALAQAEAAHKAESRDKAVQKKKYEKKLEDFKAYMESKGKIVTIPSWAKYIAAIFLLMGWSWAPYVANTCVGALLDRLFLSLIAPSVVVIDRSN